MRALPFTILLLSISWTDGFIFGSKNKCPIKQYKSSKVFIGDKLLVHESLHDRLKTLESVAKTCKVHVNVKGSYYQLRDPSTTVDTNEYDIVIGHAFQFELRDENDNMLCNRQCLSRYPIDASEVKCFIQGAINNGLTWSRYNPTVISDGTYASNPSAYQALKVDIQTKCAKEHFKREFLMALRELGTESDESSESLEQESDESTDDFERESDERRK